MNEIKTPDLALEPSYYTDPAVFDQEMRKIFGTGWIYAGHASQLRKTGDYFTFSIYDQDLFTIRDKEGRPRSFYNVCQHRAHELLEGSGNRRMIVCPYHAWSYDLEGKLRKAPSSETTPGFDGSGICLTEVKTEDFNGFLFVNLDPEARPMDEWFPGVREQLAAFVPDIDQLAPVLIKEIPEACNWKITVENYSECYHCTLNHPTFAQGVIEPTTYNIMPQGYCLRHTTRSAHLERMTYAIDPKANEHAGDYSSWFLWPAFSFQVYPGNLLNTYFWQPEDVGHTMVHRGWYTVEGVESHTITRLAEQDLNTTVAEDIRLVESVQRGLKSRGYRTGPLVLNPALGVNSEHSIKAIHDWVRKALA